MIKALGEGNAGPSSTLPSADIAAPAVTAITAITAPPSAAPDAPPAGLPPPPAERASLLPGAYRICGIGNYASTPGDVVDADHEAPDEALSATVEAA